MAEDDPMNKAINKIMKYMPLSHMKRGSDNWGCGNVLKHKAQLLEDLLPERVIFVGVVASIC